MSYAHGVISRAAFGDGAHGFDGDEGGEKLRELFANFEALLGTATVGEFVPWLAWVDKLMGLDAKAARISAELDGLLERVIADHRERRSLSQPDGGDGDGDGDENVDHRDFVDVLLDVSEAEERAGAGEVLFDTVAIKAIILGEIRAAVGVPGASGGAEVTEDHLGELRFLRAVVKETLRLHAPVPLLVPRETVEDTELLGYRVPARTRVIINVWAIGRDAAAWGADRAEEFVPERWLDGGGSEAVEYAAQQGQDFRFVPFGAGRRGCPGAGFAAPSIELALANLLYHFDWELPPHADGAAAARLDMGELFGLSMRMKTTLNLVAKPWSSDV
uniref:Cytochrome P450 71A1 n=1 Tax=Oryza glumipatula TaxID=40148 RepID=A0A0D9Y5Y8_9ORYZ